MRQELPEGPGKLCMRDPLNIHLRWAQNEDAKDERNDQPLEPFGKKLSVIPALEGVVDGDG